MSYWSLLPAAALHRYYPPGRDPVDAPHGVNLPGECDSC